MRNLYIISFGTSSKYRYYDSEQDLLGKETANDIKSFLCQKFPELRGLKYLETADIRPVDPADQDKYMSYPILDEKAIHDIERHLDTEATNDADTRELNSNAPFSDPIDVDK